MKIFHLRAFLLLNLYEDESWRLGTALLSARPELQVSAGFYESWSD